MSNRLERDIQSDIIKDLERLFEPDIIVKNDSSYLQGIPDLLMVLNGRAYWLEVKKHQGAAWQPNQEWYLQDLNTKSFATVIYPENKENVYDEIRQACRNGGHARFPLGQ